MLINSLEFYIFLFFSVILLLNIKPKYKKGILLILNLIFYSYGNIINGFLFLFFIIITYFISLILNSHKNKLILCISIIITILPLILYKYFNFIINEILGIKSEVTIFTSIPLGISFFTFQIIGYFIDIYNKKYDIEKNIINYFLFVSLFPQISSGPIARGNLLLPQIREYSKVEVDYKKIVSGFRFILFGYLLKIVISERLSIIVNSVYSRVDNVSGLSLAIAAFYFTIQIYCDFCGYSFIAYGMAKTIGIDVIQNFNKPYTSKSITEFWRRWHISLSTWFRDYVYIPLGGSKCSKLRQYINLLVTFILSGLWHGANWTFIIWGALNGFILIIEKATGFYKKKEGKVKNVLSWLITFIIINISWIFFRANTISDAFKIIYKISTETVMNIKSLTSLSKIIYFVRNLGVTIPNFIASIIALVIFLIYVISMKNYNYPDEIFEKKSITFRWSIYFIIILTILILGITGEASQFIYSKF